MQEFHRDGQVVQLLEIGQPEGAELVFAEKTDDIIQQKDTVDGWKGFHLQAQPLFKERRDPS